MTGELQAHALPIPAGDSQTFHKNIRGGAVPAARRQRGRPRKLQMDRQAESPSAENHRKRTREPFDAASYQPTSRSRPILNEPFHSLSRPGSHMARGIAQVDSLELM